MSFLSVVQNEVAEAQMIISTPKEIASLRILGKFGIKNISLAIFDNSDTVLTTHLVVEHLLLQLRASTTKIAVTVEGSNLSEALKKYATGNSFKKAYILTEGAYQYNKQFLIKCFESDFEEKLKITADLVAFATEKSFQTIIFCNVSTKCCN